MFSFKAVSVFWINYFLICRIKSHELFLLVPTNLTFSHQFLQWILSPNSERIDLWFDAYKPVFVRRHDLYSREISVNRLWRPTAKWSPSQNLDPVIHRHSIPIFKSTNQWHSQQIFRVMKVSSDRSVVWYRLYRCEKYYIDEKSRLAKKRWSTAERKLIHDKPSAKKLLHFFLKTFLITVFSTSV